MYSMHNIRFRDDEFAAVVNNFAKGLMPLGLFKCYNEERYTSSIPESPSEGSEIVTMPNYETFAVFKGGKWHITNRPYYGKDHMVVNAKMLPSINGIPTV